MVYIGGVEIPLVELFLGIGVISIIILVELIAILILISFHMKNSRKLEEEMGKLTHALLTIQGKEYAEFANIKKLEEREEAFITKLSSKRKEQAKKQAPVVHSKQTAPVKAVEKKQPAAQVQKKESKPEPVTQNKVIKDVDHFFEEWK